MNRITQKNQSRRAVALAASTLFTMGFNAAALAQNAPATLQKVIVTGNPLGSAEVASPVLAVR